MSCYHPNVIKNNNDKLINVPCGKCPGCRRRLQNEWFVRLKDEKRKWPYTRFITLTYNDENIPFSVDDDAIIHYNVKKEDLQKFFKRMRKNNKIKYFAVSEYGKDGRPHYHLLLFSVNRVDIEKYWKYGFIYDLPANTGSFRYVTKYLLKGGKIPEGSSETFSLMSKRPGIGKDLSRIDNELIDKLLSDPVCYHNNVPLPLPRYYRKKLYERLPDNGEMKKSEVMELLENKVMSDLYVEFLKNHDAKDDFYKWSRSMEASQLKQQIIIKNGNH